MQGPLFQPAIAPINGLNLPSQGTIIEVMYWLVRSTLALQLRTAPSLKGVHCTVPNSKLALSNTTHECKVFTVAACMRANHRAPGRGNQSNTGMSGNQITMISPSMNILKQSALFDINRVTRQPNAVSARNARSSFIGLDAPARLQNTMAFTASKSAKAAATSAACRPVASCRVPAFKAASPCSLSAVLAADAPALQQSAFGCVSHRRCASPSRLDPAASVSRLAYGRCGIRRVIIVAHDSLYA